MKTVILKRVISLAAGVALLAGCASQQPAPAQGPEMPPPPESEVIPPQPYLTYIWTPGYWDWRGHWVWVSGYWGQRPHPGSVWVQGHWVRHGHRYVWIHPHWQ